MPGIYLGGRLATRGGIFERYRGRDRRGGDGASGAGEPSPSNVGSV